MPRKAQKATNETLLLTDDTNGTKLHKRNAGKELVMSEVKEKKVVGIRLVDLMRERLSVQAELNGRSLSGEIVYRLRKSLEQEGEHEKQRA
jgi:hypothetical protein